MYMHVQRFVLTKILFSILGMSGLVGSPFSAMNPFALQPCNAPQPYGSSIVSPAK